MKEWLVMKMLTEFIGPKSVILDCILSTDIELDFITI